MYFTFFSVAGAALFIRDDASKAEWVQDQMELRATFPIDDEKPIQRMQRVGFTDDQGIFQCFEIYRAQTDQPAGTQTLRAVHICVAELRDYVLGVFTPTNATPANAITQALTGTSWALGTCTATNTATLDDSYKDVWTAVADIRELWGLRITPRVTFGASGISGKYLDVAADTPIQTGLRLSLERNLPKVQIIYDDSDVKTALYAYGKTTTTDGVENTVNIGPAVWSTAAGNPANKPAGQLYVEDASATAAFGRNGTPRFGIFTDYEQEDPTALLAEAWEALQAVNSPKLSITGTVLDLYAMGYTGEPILLGGAANVDVQGLKVASKIIKYTQDLLYPEKSKVNLGNFITDIVWSQTQTAQKAQAGAQVAQSNPTLLQGYLNTMVTAILSTGTTMYTDPSDGSLVFVTSDGTQAVRITGAGILLASSKVGDQWQWRTAITGGGIVADEITTGTLQAALVKILGNANFFWDAGNIVCQNPANPQQQIRFGLYDGTNYGIAFTTNGGQTWSQAITFTGVTATNLNAATGTFTGELRAATGTFAGALQAATGTFSGDISAANGTFTGNVYAKNIQVGDTPGYISGGQIGSRTVTSANLSEVYATQGAFDSLQADVAELDRLMSGQAVIQSLHVRQMLYAGQIVEWGTASSLDRFLGN